MCKKFFKGKRFCIIGLLLISGIMFTTCDALGGDPTARAIYRIVFNDGNGRSESVTFRLGYSNALDKTIFELEGHTLTDWSITPDGDSVVTRQNVNRLITRVGQTVTLYAIWRPHTYRVEYHPNFHRGGLGKIEKDDQIFTFNIAQNLMSIEDLRFEHENSAYFFHGWAREYDSDRWELSDGDGGDTALNLTTEDGGEVTLYALWGPASITITFIVPPGAEVSPPSQQIKFGTSVTLPNNATRSGFRLIGWSESPPESDSHVNFHSLGNFTPRRIQNFNMYAVWEPVDGDITPTRVIQSAHVWVADPVTGRVPSHYVTDVGSGGISFRSSVVWYPDHSPFLGGRIYTATVTLTANADTTFTGGLEDGARVNIFEVTPKIADDGRTATLVHRFQATVHSGTPELAFVLYGDGAGYAVTGFLITVTTPPTVVEIPPFFNGLPVIAIGNNAFQGRQLASVTIPDSIASIGDRAFWNNRLTELIIPDSVTSIGNEAFRNNQLTCVTIGNSVETIGAMAFMNNELTEVDIPDSVTSIGDSAFANNQLTSVTIGNRVETIGARAFWNNALTEVDIPDSVTYIGDFAFEGNQQLACVTIGNSVETIGAMAFTNNRLTEVTIPNSVTSIGDVAFFNNQLTSVTIGNRVETIGNDAFRDNQLTDIIIPASVISIGNTTFANNPLTSVFIPFNMEIANSTWGFSWSNFIPEASITWLVFASKERGYAVTGLFNAVVVKDIVIPSVYNSSPVTAIGDSAFQSRSLTSVIIPNSVESIGAEAFADNYLTSIIIPSRVESIGAEAFADNDLTTIIMPAGLINIGDDAMGTHHDSFIAFYIAQGRQAGMYIFNGTWIKY